MTFVFAAVFLLGVNVFGMQEADEEVGVTLAAPDAVSVADTPNDAGESLTVRWRKSADDDEATIPRKVLSYEIQRREGGQDDDAWAKAGEATYGVSQFVDQGCERGKTYEYRVIAFGAAGLQSEASGGSAGIAPVVQWFDTSKAWFLILLLVVGGSVIYFIEAAKAGKELKVRKIAGLVAVEEAVGRATELGRSVLFVPGIQDINDIQTLAGITVLSSVAAKAAEYDAALEVPTSRSLVMTTARETVHAAFLAAGRPDAYREDRINYLTDEQFGYVAGVTGKMVRDKPAACFYMGAFYAESLILAETGNSIGAIQIAGTAMPSQLPFFVAACDYTLIGEEFFAASAYLSGEAHQLGSLKGQDVGKLVGVSMMLIGCLFATLYSMVPSATFANGIANFLSSNVFGSGGFLP